MFAKFIIQIRNHPTRLFAAFSFSVSLAWFVILFKTKVHMYHSMMLTSDLAYYCNMLYNTMRGNFLYSDYGLFFYGFTTFLSDHFSPSIALLAPLYSIFPSPVFLLFLQVASVAMAGWLMAMIGKILAAKDDSLPKWSLVVPILFQIYYLFHPSTIYATIDTVYGFHHDSLIPLSLSAMFFFYLKYDAGRSENNKAGTQYLVLSGICYVILLGLKENMPFVCAFFFIPLYIFNRGINRRLALWAIICCVVMWIGSVVFQYSVVTNTRNIGVVSRFFVVDEWIAAIQRIGEWRPLLGFMFLFLVPEAILPFLSELFLQLIGGTKSYNWHGFPIFAIGCIGAVAGIIRFLRRLADLEPRTYKPAIFLLAACTVWLYFLPILNGCKSLKDISGDVFKNEAKVKVADIEAMAQLIPLESKLAVTSELLVFFVNRPHLRWPEQLEGIDFVLTSDYSLYSYDFELRRKVRQLRNDGILVHVKRMGLLNLYRHCAR